MNRIRIRGQVNEIHEQIIELSDEELQTLRKDLDLAKYKGNQAIDNFLGKEFSDGPPVDWTYSDWSADLIEADGSTIESLDCD